MKTQRLHYFYKITNNINNKFYYGIHSTFNINDGYMGSGSALNRAIKKYGIENFSKEILKFFDSREELELYEAKIVNKNLLDDINCYNIALGGKSPTTIDSVSVIDENGKFFRVNKNDPRYLNVSLISVSKGYVTVYNKELNKYVTITKEEYKNNKDLYCTSLTGKVVVYDENNKIIIITTEEFYKNKYKYKSIFADKIVVKDINGNTFAVSLTDERYLSGELVPLWKDKKHSSETKQKIKNSLNTINHQQKENNSQYGTCWMNNGNENIKVSKLDINKYITFGYVKGRFIKNKENIIIKNQNKTWINKNGNTCFIYKDDLYDYIKDGWLYGRSSKLTKRATKTESFKLYNIIYKEIFGEDYPLLMELNMKRG